MLIFYFILQLSCHIARLTAAIFWWWCVRPNSNCTYSRNLPFAWKKIECTLKNSLNKRALLCKRKKEIEIFIALKERMWNKKKTLRSKFRSKTEEMQCKVCCKLAFECTQSSQSYVVFLPTFNFMRVLHFIYFFALVYVEKKNE